MALLQDDGFRWTTCWTGPEKRQPNTLLTACLRRPPRVIWRLPSQWRTRRCSRLDDEHSEDRAGRFVCNGLNTHSISRYRGALPGLAVLLLEW